MANRRFDINSCPWILFTIFFSWRIGIMIPTPSFKTIMFVCGRRDEHMNGICSSYPVLRQELIIADFLQYYTNLAMWDMEGKEQKQTNCFLVYLPEAMLSPVRSCDIQLRALLPISLIGVWNWVIEDHSCISPGPMSQSFFNKWSCCWNIPNSTEALYLYFTLCDSLHAFIVNDSDENTVEYIGCRKYPK